MLSLLHGIPERDTRHKNPRCIRIDKANLPAEGYQNRIRQLCQIRMFKICGIESAGCQDGTDAAAIDALHRVTKQFCIIVVVGDAVLCKRTGTCNAGQLTCDQRIACTGRDSQIILQDVSRTVLSLYQIDAGNVGVDLLRRCDTLTLGKIAFR